MRKEKERGAIVVEGIISLTTFMFAIFTILSIVNICYIQAKMNVALHSAAKEISQYSFFYYKFGLDQLDAGLAEGTGDEKQLAMNTIDGMGTLMDSLSQANQNAQTGNFEGMVNSIEGGVDNVDSLVDQYADAIADDPKGFILGMGKMALNEMKEGAKQILCQALTKAFMKKNLKASPSDDPESFLLRYGVVDGMAGLDFTHTTFLQDGASNLIQLVVTYDVRVIELLGFEYDFTFRHCVLTTAWGRGISKVSPGDSMESVSPSSTIWDVGDGARGKYIVDQEKENYDYVSTGDKYDAYDPDTNTVISIISIDTNTESGSTAAYIEKRLKQTVEDMEDGLADDDNQVSAENSKGENYSGYSDPATRNYSVVLVVPDGADMAAVRAAVEAYMRENPGVTVEIKTGYGDPTPKDPPEEKPTTAGK